MTKINTKIKVKVDAVSAHYEGWGRDALLCVEPIGTLETTDLIPVATSTEAGLMSAEDKVKLDGLINPDYSSYVTKTYVDNSISLASTEIKEYIDNSLEWE